MFYNLFFVKMGPGDNMIKEFIKTHKHAWVFLYFIFYMPWYFGLQLRDPSTFHNAYVALDGMIPFVPLFIIPYIYWFAFVGCTIAFLFLCDVKEFYKCVAFLFIGMTVCLIVFTLYPTTFYYRPAHLSGTPVEKFFLNLIYTADKPQNVFPSIHVYNSIGCAIALTHSKKFKGNHKMQIFAFVSAFLITLSTMFIKQHSCMDALGAGILAIFMYILIYSGKGFFREKSEEVITQKKKS